MAWKKKDLDSIETNSPIHCKLAHWTMLKLYNIFNGQCVPKQDVLEVGQKQSDEFLAKFPKRFHETIIKKASKDNRRDEESNCSWKYDMETVYLSNF